MDDFEKQLAVQIDEIVSPNNNLKKDGTPRKKSGPKPKEPDSILPATISQAGKSGRERSLNPKEREALRSQLVQYYGNSKIEKYLLSAIKLPEISERLCRMRDIMEQEIKQAEIDQIDYFKTIDSEYKKLGRPNAPFTWREFDYLCSIACPIEEIAGFFDLEPDTLRKKVKAEYGVTFNNYYERRSQGIKIALRRSQINNAISGDTSMQKFLGINLLGQKNKVDFTGQVQINTFADLVKNLDNKSNGENSNVSDSDEDD